MTETLRRSSPTAKVGYVIVVAENLADIESINELLRFDSAVVVVRAVEHAAHWMAREREGSPDPGDGGPGDGDRVRVGRLEIRPGERRVLWCGRPLDLSQQEVSILSCLAGAPGRAYSFKEIAEAAWGGAHRIEPTVVHSALRRLRRKLAGAGVGARIESVRGYGLRLIPEGTGDLGTATA
ncbi:winged helix-turn-helix domain-containing protein [Actinomadura hibisca]|uniref:winged helix-turn-helix domain-containing protein n=1 Tax=Actinomadura hibisca TaxID=68565 RepID=UPI00082B8466|nr:winged helix-turn-helix domain-containing protein [Actinomadura hibisca]